LVISKKTNIASNLSKYIKDSGLNNSTKTHKGSGRGKIKNHDVYVIDTQNMVDSEIAKILRRICKTNPKAQLFIKGDIQESIAKESIEKYIDPIKMGETFVKIPQDEDLSGVIEYLSFLEHTKKKMAGLWQKLETL